MKWYFVFLGKSGGTETLLGGFKIDPGSKEEDHLKKFRWVIGFDNSWM